MGRRAAKNAERKGKSDALKAKLYGKYGKMVLQAAKSGGPDPQANSALHQIIEQARRAGVPKEIVERNVKRASEKGASDFEDTVVEVYGPGGTGFIMECLTDNRQRAATDIWTVVKKLNGKIGESGSVLFNFKRRGEIALRGVNEEVAFEVAMSAGAEDVEPYVHSESGELLGYRLVTAAEHFGAVRGAIADEDLIVDEEASGLSYKPLATVKLEEEEVQEANELIYERWGSRPSG